MDNERNTERCKRVVTAIANLESTEKMELFRLLHKCKCEYTRNNNGIFINMSWLSDEILDKIEQYISFCNKSHNEVQRYESICDVLNKNIHDTKIKDASKKTDVHIPHSIGDSLVCSDVKKQSAPKMSSSMRFYLLKKRFSKHTPLTTTAKNDLSTEPYLLQ